MSCLKDNEDTYVSYKFLTFDFPRNSYFSEKQFLFIFKQ